MFFSAPNLHVITLFELIFIAKCALENINIALKKKKKKLKEVVA